MNSFSQAYDGSIMPVLKIVSGKQKGKQFRLLSKKIILGRQNDCDVVFKDNPTCSRQHAEIRYKDKHYIITSLNGANPVLVNGQAIDSHVFKPKDKVAIGNIEMIFLQRPYSFPKVKKSFSQKKIKKNFFNGPRLLLILFLGLGVYLFLENEKDLQEKKINLQGKSNIEEEIKQLKKANETLLQKAELSPKEKMSQDIFLKGFRDYRKGYFQRAIASFRHCLTIYRKSKLCQSYLQKSKRQIDYLIQKKIRLGKSYKDNQQYEACKAAFESVEIMVQDSKSLLYKEAKENRRECEIYLKNRI